MIDTINQIIANCQWDTANFLVVSGNVFDPFIYYSHIVPLTISLLIGFFIFLKNKTILINQILFLLTILFSTWVFFDLILWATDIPTYTIFFWSFINLIEPCIYFFSFYFVQVFITGNDTSLKNKLFYALPIIPVFVFAFTRYDLLGFNLSNCDREAIEGPLAHYIYIIEVLYVICIALYAMHQFAKNRSTEKRRQIVLITTSILSFLLAFSWGNIVGSLTDSWRVSQWGLFGMPVFILALAYLIVKYNAFNIKVISTQILVTAFPILVGSQYFLTQSKGSKIITIITTICSIIAGIFLTKSVKREVEAREKIEKLAVDLQKSNDGQSNLIHIMNHQIKGYLAKARGIFSELLTEPAYGPVSDAAKPMIDEGLRSLTEGVEFVGQVLNGSSAASGTLQYTMKPVDVKTLVEDDINMLREKAEKKGLTIESHMDEGNYTIQADAIQLKEALRNLIDNSIIYTEKGGLTITLTHHGDRMLFTVKDTGVGISPEDKQKLFTKGGRGKDALRINVNSTGYGLAFVKGVIDAHKGKVWVDSDGAGKGSTFSVEIPIHA